MLKVNVGDTTCLGYGDESKLGSNCVLLKRPTGDCIQEAKGSTLLGLACKMSYVCRKCGCNAHNAMCNRHGVKQPLFKGDFAPFRAFVNDALVSLREKYRDYLGHYEAEWLAKWPARKQVAIVDSELCDPIQRDRVKNMVKREGAHKEVTKARCIQYYPNLATQSEFAPQFTALQKTYTEEFRIKGDRIRVTIGSGMNARDLGVWMEEVLSRYSQPHFYERDGKSWDATMNMDHQDLKEYCYALAGQDLVDAARESSTVVGTGYYPTGVLKYKLSGTTKSGHNDTSLGNGLVNAGIAFCAATRMGLLADIIVAGDDLLVVIEGDYDEDLFSSIEADFGIVPEYRKFRDVRDVSFISGIWFPTASGLVFTAKPGRLLARLFWSVKPPSRKKFKSHVHSIVCGIWPTMGEMPVLGAFLIANDYPDAEEIEISYGSAYWTAYRREFYRAGVSISRGDLVGGFCDRYGLSTQDIECAERFLSAHRHKVGIVKHWVLDRIMDVDLADLDVRPTLG